MINISKYRTILFDCDGVILNSNSIKTESFFEVARPHSYEAALTLKNYHINHGGISRNIKFKYFVEALLGISESEELVAELVHEFSNNVTQKLLNCEMSSALPALKKLTPSASWAVVSGGNESELRKIFATRNIDHFFELGIYGSPAPKDEIITHLNAEFGLDQPVLFIGDSEYDYKIASEMGMDFLFISEWTEFQDWRVLCSDKSIPNVRSLALLADFEAELSPS